MKRLQGLEVSTEQKLVSYDVTALFTSVPVDKALEVITRKLNNDDTLEDRTDLTVEQISQLLEVCLNTTYFLYNGKYYQQTHGAAMGSPISPLVANLYMEHFEEEALSTAPTRPYIWIRYVDDTFVKISKLHVEEFTKHINDIDPHIKFTVDPEDNMKLPMLDICTNILEDRSTKLTIYRKPTHTDQYLNWKSHHPLVHKRSVVRTLIQRAKQYVTTDEDKKAELAHVRHALRAND